MTTTIFRPTDITDKKFVLRFTIIDDLDGLYPGLAAKIFDDVPFAEVSYKGFMGHERWEVRFLLPTKVLDLNSFKELYDTATSVINSQFPTLRTKTIVEVINETFKQG